MRHIKRRQATIIDEPVRKGNSCQQKKSARGRFREFGPHDVRIFGRVQEIEICFA
jgi:hypothetical protein